MNGSRRNTGGQERSVADDLRDLDPASWPYAGQVPPAQVALQEERRRQGQPGPALVPRFTSTEELRLQRIPVTGAHPQVSAKPPPRPQPEPQPQVPLQATEHPAGTFTAVSPWEEWLRRCQPGRYPAPERSTPCYGGTLRDHAGREMNAALGSPGEPWEVAPPEHRSWRERQQTAMTPLPECDATARFRSARAYMRTMDRFTRTHGMPLAKAALPVAGAEGQAWAWLALANGIREAGEAVAGMRHGNSGPYLSLAEYVMHAPDYETALWLVGLAVEARLVNRAEIEGSGR